MDKINFKPSGGGNPKTFREMLPYLTVKNGLLQHADRSFAWGMELYSCSDESATDEMLKERSDLFRRLLLNLNPELTLAIHLTIDPGAPEILKYHEGRKSHNEIFNRIHNERIRKIKERIEKRELRRVRIFIFLYYKPLLKKSSSFRSLFRSRVSFRKDFEDVETEALNKLRHQGEVFKRMLGNSEFRLVDMTEEDYTAVVYQHLNPLRLLQTPHTPKLNHRSMRDRLCLSDLFIEKDCIEFGSFYHKIISLHELPEHTYPDMISALLNLRTKDNKLFTNFAVTTIVSIPDQEKEISKLKRERIKASGIASDGLKNDIEAQVQMEETTELVGKLRSTSEKLIHFSLYVGISSRDKEELKSMESSVISTFSSLEGTIGYSENYGTLPIFLDTLPGYPVETSRRQKITTTNSSHLLTIHRPFEGSRYPAVIFENRAQGLAGYGLNEDKDQDAKHVYAFGPTGSGKSVTILYILANFMVFNPVIRIIDAAKIGGTSYEKFNFLVNYGSEKDKFLKTLLRIDIDSGICINMFDIEELTNDAINNLGNIIESMVLEPGQKAIPKLRRAKIEQDIKILYDKIKKPILSDFCNICSDPETKEILQGIWIRGRKYGKLVDGYSNVELDGPILTYDLKNLSRFPDLQRVMLQVVVNNIWMISEKYRYRPKIIPMDETWDILSNEAGQNMLSEFYRTLRKINGVAISISQSLSDIVNLDPKIKAGIFENIGTFFICKPMQLGSVYETIAKELDLNDAEMNMIKNLERVPGEYNEVFILQTGNFGKRSGVVRVALSPFELWAFTTDPNDNHLFDEYRERYKDEPVTSILNRLAKDFPKGANR